MTNTTVSYKHVKSHDLLGDVVQQVSDKRYTSRYHCVVTSKRKVNIQIDDGSIEKILEIILKS